MKIRIHDSEFVRSNQLSSDIEPLMDFEGCERPTKEILVLGRSNVGKSTLINRMTARNKLAKVSSTPGKTRLYNEFLVKISVSCRDDEVLKDEVSGTHIFRLLDVPGYGYAKFSRTERAQVSREIVSLLTRRESLSLVCLLNDCKRTPQEDELSIRNLSVDNGIPLLVVLTKLDKLNQKETVRQVRKLSSAYGLEESDFVKTGNKTPIDRLWGRIVTALV